MMFQLGFITTFLMASASAFAPPSFVARSSSLQRNMVAGNLEDPDNAQLVKTSSSSQDVFSKMMDFMDQKMQHVAAATNPANAFGSPISKEVKGFNKISVDLIKGLVFDTAFAGEGRDMARFYALETIARMPYFSYLFVLHFYETTGWWRKADYLKIHFAETWNEHHHLLIMEELGGSEKWFDRFLAQHVALGYFWIVVILYLINPTIAYNLNQNVEEHAYATYDAYLHANEEELKQKPAPQVAIDYYHDGDLYLMDAFQTDCVNAQRRRPEIRNLYDVFVAIRDDELEHVKTMASLQEGVSLQSVSDDDTCGVPAFD